MQINFRVFFLVIYCFGALCAFKAGEYYGSGAACGSQLLFVGLSSLLFFGGIVAYFKALSQ